MMGTKETPCLKVLIGGSYLKTETHNYLFGSRTGIHQELMLLNGFNFMTDKLPDTVFLSDLDTVGNISCIDLEFVFLSSLFLGLDFPNGIVSSRLFNFAEKKVIRKFRVVIEKGKDFIVWNQLEPSLLGASKGMLESVCKIPSKLSEMLIKEANFFNLKDKDGYEFKISDFIEIYYYDDDGTIALDDINVHKKDVSKFVVSSPKYKKLEIDVNFQEKQVKPTWLIPRTKKPFSYGDVSIIPLGTSSPFNPQEPPTSYWLKSGTREHFLIDCGFFTDIVFRANGGDVNLLKGIILTHCHGDHLNLLPYMYIGRPLELWTTEENYILATKITCAKTGVSEEEFQSRFIHKKVEALAYGYDAPFYHIGILDIQFHYSVHSIPTVGLTIYKEKERLLFFSSDTVDLSFITNAMYKKGVIPEERYEMLLERFRQDLNEDTLFLVDCGGGLIHGNADGYKPFYDDTTKVVECHRGPRLENEKSLFQLAEPLSVIEIVPNNFDVRSTAVISQLLKNFNVESIVDWAAVLHDTVKVKEYSPMQPVLVAGNKTNDTFYVIDYGMCESDTGLTFSVNQWFGEESLIDEERYGTTIHTKSPVRLFLLNSSILKKALKIGTIDGEKTIENIKKLFNYRRGLASARMFADMELSVNIIDGISLELTTEHYDIGEYIYREDDHDDGHMFIILSGKLEVELKAESVILNANDIVGERVAFGKSKTRNATVKVISPTKLIRIPRKTFKKLMEDVRIYNRIKVISDERTIK